MDNIYKNLCEKCKGFKCRLSENELGENKKFIMVLCDDFISEDTIKSVTTCPTCGSECTVGGDGETHYYVPVKKIN